MKRNIFEVGPQVSGESQIGYGRYIDEFTRLLLTTNTNISITGLKRFGKTSIAKTVINNIIKIVNDKNTLENTGDSNALENIGGNFGENIIYDKVIPIFIDLALCGSKYELCHYLVEELDFWIKDNDINEIADNTVYKKRMDDFKNVNENQFYIGKVFSIFGLINRLQYHIILFIDEFDKASDIFNTNQDYEFLRELCTNNDKGTSLVLISRRQVYMIENRNQNNSTLHGVVQTYPIKGFNDSDLESFFEKLKEYGIELSESEKERLDYYCGKSPFLNSMFAFEMVNDYKKKINDYSEIISINIDDIYRRRQIDIENYYRSVYACLENDKISVDEAYQDASSIEKLVGIILGPSIDVIQQDIDLMENMGYLRKDVEPYISISRHFTNYLRRVPLNVDTWTSILGLEKKIKSMIRKKIMEEYTVEYIDYELWEEIFENAGAGNILDTYDRFIDDSMNEYQMDVDLLDVCSLDVAVDILRINWENWFSQYFNNDGWEIWEDKLRLCAKARNPMAHGHAEFLSPETRSQVNNYSEEIIILLADNNACMDHEIVLEREENKRKVQVRHMFYTLQYSPVDPSLKGMTVKMTAAEPNRRGVRGYFNIGEKYYKCTIGKNRWNDKFP
ncbi:MAG: hypothetical protein K6E10_05925, partial [Eubacterium sp.]|nr:hypothetical protein [Eubacterium sp.]